MSETRDIQAAQALSTKAAQKELSRDFDAAFELHVKAAQSFIHLAQTLSDVNAKANCKAAAAKALERAEQIKKVKQDVRPVAADPYSSVEQAYILDKSSLINGRKFPPWQEADSQLADGHGIYQDPDGQPLLAPLQQSQSVPWLRPTAVFRTPLQMVDPTLGPDDLVQNLVTDCSVVAAISVCLEHQRRFGSKIGLSSLYPQDANGFPQISQVGKYAARVFINGAWRKIVIDDALPFLESGQLLGISTGNKEILWPPLLEKAYMKLMGGYDFPGSNSGTDLHTLIGWIPEHVHMRSTEFRMEKVWTKIMQGFSKGQCLVTLGTLPALNDRLDHGLLPAHNYAVLDIQDDDEEQYITLCNSWRKRSIQETLPSGCEPAIQEVGSSTSLRLTWREACALFDTLHLSWNPSLFQHRVSIHGLWKSSETSSKHTHPGEHQYPSFVVMQPNQAAVSHTARLSIRGCQTRDAEIWVLLTRHIVDKHEKAHFISLMTILHDDTYIKTSAGKPLVHGTYTDSPHDLKRFSPPLGDSVASIVTSLEGADTSVRYTITVLSHHQEVVLEHQPQKGLYSKTVTGTLSSRSSGGNHTYPTFMMNPQYHLRVRPNAAGPGSNDNSPFCFSAKGPKDLPLNVKIVWSNGQRVTELVAGDVAADTGAYSYGVAYGERGLKAGAYTLIVSAFEPRQHGEFELSLNSSQPFDLQMLPAEGAGMYTKTLRGEWTQENSGGSPTFGKYHTNPFIKVHVPNPMQIMIRLQLLRASAAVALNASLFVMEETGGLGNQVLTSAGNYLLVPSTYASGVFDAFQVLLYSTGGGVHMSWWGH